MPEGTVEVELIKGHDLKDVEIFGKSDPYATLNIGGQKQRSKTIHGSNPVWNESFLIEIPDGPHDLDIVVFDQERRGADEAMGSVNIPLIKLFAERQIPPSKYKVQRPNGKFEGELEVGLKFFPKVHLLEAHRLLGTRIHLVRGCMESDSQRLSNRLYWSLKALQPIDFSHYLRVCDVKKVRPLCSYLLPQRYSKKPSSCNPVWDEHFSFQVDNEVTEVLIKLFDKDDLKADNPLGNAVVPLHSFFRWPFATNKIQGARCQRTTTG